MDTNSVFGEILETGKTTVKNVAKSAKQGTQTFAKTAVGQVSGSQSSNSDQGTNEQANVAAQNQQQMTDKDRVEFLRNLYGKSDNGSNSNQKIPPGRALRASPNVGKTPEELAKIEALRQQLHGDYYQTLINPQKPQEESVTEKLEREDQEEQFETLQKEKEKPDPLANVKQGTGESVVGVRG